MGKEVQPKVSSDRRCEVRIMYFRVCFLVLKHTYIKLAILRICVQFCQVHSYCYATNVHSSSSSCKSATLNPLNTNCSSPPPFPGNHYSTVSLNLTALTASCRKNHTGCVFLNTSLSIISHFICHFIFQKSLLFLRLNNTQ
ncbi:unnamed protein product [Rangifer tarandus platyrhynchus]|uniref:Uncharacterized protein n=1 Tax=Rangifer tarandus platyrhynchus TaxID=3082113 RepID=A0AC59YTH8_RANTA